MAKISSFSSPFMSGPSVETYSGSEKTERMAESDAAGSRFFSEVHRHEGSDPRDGSGKRFAAASEEWEKMRGKITALGKEVVNTRSPEVIREYKKQIKKLMEAVITASLREKEVRFTRRIRGAMPRQEILRLVEVIDGKLNQLTVDLMEEQSRPIRILSRINEIEGLIVDLLS